jgi:hypothetical protein
LVLPLLILIAAPFSPRLSRHIRLFEAIDPSVRAIETRAGGVLDGRYFQHSSGWKSYGCRAPLMTMPKAQIERASRRKASRKSAN